MVETGIGAPGLTSVGLGRVGAGDADLPNEGQVGVVDKVSAVDQWGQGKAFGTGRWGAGQALGRARGAGDEVLEQDPWEGDKVVSGQEQVPAGALP